MSDKSASEGNDKKKLKQSEEGNGSTGQAKDSGGNGVKVKATVKPGKGRGRGESSSESSGSNEQKSNAAPSGESASTNAPPKSIASEDRRDARTLLFLGDSTYNTRPESYQPGSTPKDDKLRFVANHFRIQRSKDFEFIQYRVDISPEEERKSARRKLVANCRNELRGNVFDGGNLIYVTRPLRENPLQIATRLDREERDYTVTFRRTDVTVRMTDNMALHVLNCIMRKAMAGLELKEIQRHLYDMGAKVPMPEFRIELLPGWITSIRQHEMDILLCVDITHKVMRQDNLLQILQDMMRNGPDFKLNFEREVSGTVVLTPYNDKTYSIAGVDWSLNPQSTFDMRGRQISYVEYNQTKYNIQIRDVRQPLLIAKPKARDIRGGMEELILLVPELCRATGLTDAMRSNFQQMKAMSVHTRLDPMNRARRLLEFSRRINQTQVSQGVLESFGLEMERELVQLKGRVVPQETIIFGKNSTYDNNATADWTNMIRSKTMYRNQPLQRWGIVYPIRMEREVDDFMTIFFEVAKGQEYECGQPKHIRLGDDRVPSYAQGLNEFCSKDPKFVMIFIPNNSVDRYKAIKKITYVERAIPSQVVCGKTIRPKNSNPAGLKSIATKIVLQINSKLGGAPWMIQMPMRGVMVVGYDVSHSTQNKAHSYGALVASMDLRESVKYFSAVSKHTNGEEIPGNIAVHMQQALSTYRKEHGRLPERIIFYRDGVGDGQIKYVHEYEVKKIEQVINNNYPEAKPRFAFVIVSKRINTRFFEVKSGNRYENPVPGTIVDSVVTLPNRYEFFLVSQSVRQGTVSPTNYNVIHDNLGLGADRMQQFTYKMTHLYYNWSGTTRVPAVVQYAHKLSLLVGQFMHQLPNNSTALCERLYFL